MSSESVASTEHPVKDEDPPTAEAEDPPGSPTFFRLESISGKVSDVTEKTKKLIVNMKEQAIPAKLPTVANKKTLDGIMIDERLTQSTGIVFKAKMIGSLSVQFHHGDRMAIDAIRDLKTFAKTSGRHKARIFLRLSTDGIQILEDGSMRLIDDHDIDKVSYLTQDVDEKKVFAYIYNKQILNRDKGTSTIAHRLFAIKSPKCAIIVSHMKAIFHYLYENRKSSNKVNAKNVNMVELSKARKVLGEPTAPTEETMPQGEATGPAFEYGKLVDLVDIITDEDSIAPDVTGPATNLYITRPAGNRLVVEDEEVPISKDEPLYSTVRKIKRSPPDDIEDEVGMLNPSWNSSAAVSTEDDPFSLDKYNRKSISSSSSDDDDTFTIPVQPATIPSAVYMEEYEWDIGEMRPKKYSEGQIELSNSRERISTITKKAVASLERSKQLEAANLAEAQSSSLIDFAMFEDKVESSDAVQLFDTLEKSSMPNSAVNDDLLSLVFHPTPAVATLQAQQPAVSTQKYEIDLNLLINDPNTYNTPSAGFNQPNALRAPQNTAFQTNYQPQPNAGFGGFGGAGPNYQPNYTFPVQFGNEQIQPTPPQVQSSNPFNSPRKPPRPAQTTDTFDPFMDLLNDAI